MNPLNHARIWDDLAQDFRDQADRASVRQLPTTAEGFVVMSRLAHGVAEAYRRHARGEAIEPPDPQDLPASLEQPATEDRRSPAAEGPQDFDVVAGERPLPRFPGSDE